MINQCLNKLELKKLIANKLDGRKIDDEQLKILIDNSNTYEDSLESLTYFFSQILDKMGKDGVDCDSIVENVYRFENEMLFELKECDEDFVDFMVRNKRDLNLSLEEELVDIQNRLSSHQYGGNFRFRHNRNN